MGRAQTLKEIRRKVVAPIVAAAVKSDRDATEVLRRGLLGRLKWLMFGR